MPLFNRRPYQSLVSEIPDVGTWSQTLELTDVGTWSQSDRLPTSQPKRMLQPDASRMQPMKKAKPATILQLLSAKQHHSQEKENLEQVDSPYCRQVDSTGDSDDTLQLGGW